MSGYKPGEHVKVTLEGVVREVDEDLLLVEYAIEGDIIGEAPIVPVAQAVTIERVAPAEWPPQPGDKWRDRFGTAWFAFYGLEAREVFMIPADPVSGQLSTPTPDRVLAKAGPLALVHREQLQVTPAPDDPVISQDCWQQQHTSCVGCDCACHCEADGGETA